MHHSENYSEELICHVNYGKYKEKTNIRVQQWDMAVTEA